MEHSLVLYSNSSDNFSLLQIALQILKESSSLIRHIESRQSLQDRNDESLEFLITFTTTSQLIAIDVMRQLLGKEEIFVKWTNISQGLVWFPRTYKELSKCCKALYKYGSELSSDHPGYGDKEYEKRRMYFTEIAINYNLGDSIPQVQYTEKERDTWRCIYEHQKEHYPTCACKEQNNGIKLLEENANYCAEEIPQLEQVSQYLKSRTGYQLCPVVGWIHSRDFLALLAFRVFPCTQYIRHHSKPRYTPEPDICHELLGHVPLFCDPQFADFSQNLGLASLGASDEWITKLSTLYWFTVEFGMVYEEGLPKAYGAGLLSSCEEIKHCVSKDAIRKPLDCSEAVVTSYPETGIQPLYFIGESITDIKDKMIEFSKGISKPVVTSFNKETRCIDLFPH